MGFTKPTVISRWALAAAMLALAAPACRSSWKEVRKAPSFAPTEARPVRVAVLPFRDDTGGTSPLLYPFVPLIWLANALLLSVPEGMPDSEKGAQSLRALLAARLRGGAWSVVDSATVDTTLAHKGLLATAPTLDARTLGKLLGVDAVLYGTLDSWSGRYYVLESRTVVEGTVKIVSTVDGSELFRGTVGVSDAAGLSGGPTGYVSAAATPVAALGKGPYRELAIQWAELMGSQISGAYSDEAAAQTPAPYLSVAALAGSPKGDQEYVPGEVIEVLALGRPGCTATFDLGTLRVRIPMSEFSRFPRTSDASEGEITGMYRGAYIVSKGDRAAGAPVTVTLESAGGRATALAQGGSVTIR